MKAQISTGMWHENDADWLVVGIGESEDLTVAVAALDAATGGQVGRLRESGDLTGKLAELLAVHDVPGINAKRVLFVGLGDLAELTVAKFERAFMTAARFDQEPRQRRLSHTRCTA